MSMRQQLFLPSLTRARSALASVVWSVRHGNARLRNQTNASADLSWGGNRLLASESARFYQR
jgi:hypothetical protein